MVWTQSQDYAQGIIFTKNWFKPLKAKLTVQIADVKSVFKSYAVEIQAQDINDLKEDEVTKMIKKAGYVFILL